MMRQLSRCSLHTRHLLSNQLTFITQQTASQASCELLKVSFQPAAVATAQMLINFDFGVSFSGEI